MASAKLSGSLLAYRDVPPAAPVQPLPPPGIASADQTAANRFERAESGLGTADTSERLLSAHLAAAAGGSSPSSLFIETERRFSPTLRLGLAVCGVTAATAVAIGLFINAPGHNNPTTASQPAPAPASVSNPAPMPPAATPVAALGAVAGVTLALAESPTRPATGSAAAPSLPPTPPAAPVSLQLGAVAGSLAPAAPAPSARIPAQEVAALLTRGDALLSSDDIISARLYYERAAEGGDAQAALRLGETYDPSFLARAHLNGVRGDATAAARWYRFALTLGSAEAETLLAAVSTNGDTAKRPKDMNQLFEQFLARHEGQTH